MLTRIVTPLTTKVRHPRGRDSARHADGGALVFVTVSGTGFGTSEGVNVFFDTADVALAG